MDNGLKSLEITELIRHGHGQQAFEELANMQDDELDRIQQSCIKIRKRISRDLKNGDNDVMTLKIELIQQILLVRQNPQNHAEYKLQQAIQDINARLE